MERERERKTPYDSFSGTRELHDLRVVDKQVGSGALILDMVLEYGRVGSFEPVFSKRKRIVNPNAVHFVFLNTLTLLYRLEVQS
jgi:hypothetical protein